MAISPLTLQQMLLALHLLPLQKLHLLLPKLLLLPAKLLHLLLRLLHLLLMPLHLLPANNLLKHHA